MSDNPVVFSKREQFFLSVSEISIVEVGMFVQGETGTNLLDV
jgi:hypothetical protein